MKRFIILVLLFSPLFVSAEMSDDFDDYSTGTLNGQGGWSGSANYLVDDSEYFSASNSVKITSGVVSTISTTTSSMTDGYFQVAVYSEDATDYDEIIMFQLLNSSNDPVASLQITGSGDRVRGLASSTEAEGDSYVELCPFYNDVWNIFYIYFRDTSSTSASQIAYKCNFDELDGWYYSTNTGAIDEIYLWIGNNDGSGDVSYYFDDVVLGEESSQCFSYGSDYYLCESDPNCDFDVLGNYCHIASASYCGENEASCDLCGTIDQCTISAGSYCEWDYGLSKCVSNTLYNCGYGYNLRYCTSSTTCEAYQGYWNETANECETMTGDLIADQGDTGYWAMFFSNYDFREKFPFSWVIAGYNVVDSIIITDLVATTTLYSTSSEALGRIDFNWLGEYGDGTTTLVFLDLYSVKNDYAEYFTYFRTIMAFTLWLGFFIYLLRRLRAFAIRSPNKEDA